MPLIMSLKEQQLNLKRTIVFCQRQVDCGTLYQLFEKELGKEMLDPVGTPASLPQYRLVDVFCKSTEIMVKDTILHQFTAIDSKLCVLICTSAFGMGINCSGVSRIIHWGPPNDIETYIQQTGRSGREGELSYCTLLP